MKEPVRFTALRLPLQLLDPVARFLFRDPLRRCLKGLSVFFSIDGDTLGTVFFDLTPEQEGGPGVFFIRTGLKALQGDSG